MALHIIGDSHAQACFGGFNGATIHAINSRTMHGVFNQNLKPDALGVKSGDTVVWIFGEIDIRTCVGRLWEASGMTRFQFVEKLVSDYAEHIARQEDRVGFRSIISCTVPPSDMKENIDYPFHGTLAERVEIYTELNFCLYHMAKSREIPFLQWSHHFALPDGSLNHSVSDSHVHVASHANAPCHSALRTALAMLAIT